MNITVIGASAGVGLHVTQQALERGHQVTTLSRQTATLPDHPRLRKLQGSSLNPTDVLTAIEGSEAILVTLGTGRSTRPTTLYSASADVLLGALKATKAQVPLIVLTGFGTGESWDYNTPVMKVLFRLFLKAVYADKSEMERRIAAGYNHWTFIRPGRLTQGPRTGQYRVLDHLRRDMRVGAISRADVAHFMVDVAERRTFPQGSIALSH